MIGRTLAHYRIDAAIGAGGMGEVFRATDTRLGREVALKVLSEEFASDPNRLDRFEREARAVAALNHPHIVTIHSVEEAEGVRFLTMELVDGQTLDALIPKDGLEIEPFFDLATPLAEAVSAAHEKSVIHRDLKPANVMVDRDGRVKVMDFGLAKVQEPGEVSDSSELPTEALTGIGMVVGTVPYMSPEQIEGEIVDHRTDIFSLGVLLYEMAVGERPFQGKSSPSLMSSILKDAPMPVVEIRTDLPRHLGRIIGRCLEKDRRNRYQTARDVFNELRALQREAPALTGATERSQSETESSTTAGTPPLSAALGTAGASSVSGTILEEEGFWVAVLPFKCTGGDADLTALAEGLSEEIGSGLSRFSYLQVIARGSKVVDARYLLEGSLRQVGSRLRLAIQLVDTATGTHLWAETYDRTFSPQALFELQDDLVPRIVSTVADMHGILPRRMSETVRLKPADQLTPYESLLHSFGYNERFTPDALAEARTCLERAVERAPGNADCWAMLSLMYSNEYGHYDIRNPDSFDKALEAARKAVLVGPLHTLPHYALAQAHFFRREFPAARTAAERAVSLNPMDGATAAFMGLLIAYSGNWERGCGLAERAWELNPNLPGMYHYTAWHDAYRREDYHRALELALKLNTPESYYQHAVLTMCYAQLGEMDEAHKSLRAMLAIKPDYGKVARQLHGKWIQPDLVERLMDGLSKAGLEIADDEVQSDASPVRHASGEQRADEGFWVAVLPFRYGGANADLTALAEGLSEEIVTGLSRFSYLRVIARSSTSHHSGEGHDVRSVGQELGARYVMEGSVRQAGSTLRIAAQLVDAASGAHLWAETYNRSFHPDTIFELQDDLVPRIVSTVADWYGILPHSMSEAVRSKPSVQLTPYEALLRAFGYYQRVTPEEHAAVRPLLERAVEEAPGHAAAWAMLSMLYGEEHRFGFNLEPDPLGRSLHAARRAVEAAPGSHVSHLALAQAHYFRKEFEAFRNAAERAVALNPMDGATVEYLGHLLAFAGDWERGCELGERAMQLNPNHPAWYWALPFLDAYRGGDYRGARALAPKALMPGQYYSHALFAALYGQLGDREAAGEHLREVLALRPDFAGIARDQFGRWYLPELVEQLIDGLRKAGLVIGEPAAVDAAASARAFAPTQQESAETKSIVVLPFANLSPDPDTEYFSDGLTDEIITDLSRVRALRVISRSSAMRLKGDGRDLAEIGRDLDCRYVLEGSVRRAANNLRITARLVEAPEDTQLWADKYAGSLDDVFDIQERVSRSIVDALEIQLTPQEAEQLAERPIDDVRAQESYLRARSEIWSFMPGSLDLAISHLDAALELIGDNALIYQGLGEAYFQYVNIGAAVGREEGLIRKAEDCADKIFALEPESPRGYLVRAQTRMARGEIHGCSRDLQRVLQVYPKEIMALALYTHLLGWLGGKPDAAAPVAARLDDIDPLNPMSRLVCAMVPLFAGRFQEAVEATRGMFELDPVTPVWRANHVMALSYARRFDEAEALTEAIDAQPDSDVGTWQMGLFRAAWREDRSEVLRLADGPYRQLALWDAEAPWFLALAHAAVGEKDEAMHWLDRAIGHGMINYPFLAEHDWYLDNIRGDARFDLAMERARREWERLDEVLP